MFIYTIENIKMLQISIYIFSPSSSIHTYFTNLDCLYYSTVAAIIITSWKPKLYRINLCAYGLACIGTSRITIKSYHSPVDSIR